MKISEEELERGRQTLRDKDLNALRKWLDKNNVFVDQDAFCKTLETFLRFDETKAIPFFDKVCSQVDPTRDMIVALAKLLALAIFVVGTIGGVSFLLRGCQ